MGCEMTKDDGDGFIDEEYHISIHIEPSKSGFVWKTEVESHKNKLHAGGSCQTLDDGRYIARKYAAILISMLHSIQSVG